MSEKKLISNNLEFTYFFSRGGNAPFTCFYSDSLVFKENTKYLVYDIPELLRMIIIKKEILNDELVNYYYRNSDNSLCIILEWTELVRKVVRVSAKKGINIFDEQDSIKECKTEIEKNFQKNYFKYQDLYEVL